MEPTTLGEALTREHREIDDAIEAYLASAADGTARTQRLRVAVRALRRHIYLEEEFLFPPLRDAGFIAPIVVMLREHGELWRTMDAIEQALATGTDAGLPGRCKWLLAGLDKHNAKEEPILYPHADRVLGAPASADLKAFLERGSMPDGWVCAQASVPPAEAPPKDAPFQEDRVTGD